MPGIYLSVCLSETLDNEMELFERSVLFKSVIIVTSERRLCNARRLSVCLSETLDNEMELIERSVQFMSVIFVISASRLLMPGVCLSVCLFVCLSVR